MSVYEEVWDCWRNGDTVAEAMTKCRMNVEWVEGLYELFQRSYEHGFGAGYDAALY